MTATASKRALLFLHQQAGHHGVPADAVGAAVWPDRAIRPGKGVSVNGGGDYAAQMLLGRLKKAGLVEYASSPGSTLWRLSAKGRREVQIAPSSRGSSPLPCVCGCAVEEHGHDDQHPGSTACTACSDCIAYEADPGDDE